MECGLLEKGFVVIGFPKCGQESLLEYLKGRYPNRKTKKDEIIWNKKGVEIFKEKYGDRMHPVIITREPILRMWSAYWYFEYTGETPYNERFTFPEYLKLEDYKYHIGEMNPVKQSNYQRWIKDWLELKPIIFKLETVSQNTNFPHLNQTKVVRDKITPVMPDRFYLLAKSMLDEELSHKY